MITNRLTAIQRAAHMPGGVAYVVCALAITATFVVASSFQAAALTSISQSYTTADRLALGSIVSLKDNSADHIVASSNANADGILGVVINADTSLLSLSNGEQNQAQVSTSGTVQVLVSTINGPVVSGDHITASPISGVGMKATGNVRIVGIAQGELNEKNGTKQEYKDTTGATQTVSISQIPVLVNVSYYFKEPEKTIIPSAIQSVANSLAGKPVSTLPIVISGAIFVVMLIVVVSIIYSMIRSSIISVGRNPMSQSAIYRDLIQLSALVLGILAVGFIAIYLILTKL
jgi:RNase P/RNase MRP subunit p29